QLVPFYKTAKKYYTTAWGVDFNNKDYLKLVSTIQRYVDQSISTNQYYNIVETKKVNIEDVIEEFIECFNLGVKSLYYANFRTTDDADGDQVIEGCGSGGCSV
ncbi:ribonucleotide-diphosphate reductase subunit alpha, partial [Campylobacter coli]|nr:ribonucleotide-diphosphate reductase subunit alpha [Campylobacter coli]